jgi:2-iminoacetate synthase
MAQLTRADKNVLEKPSNVCSLYVSNECQNICTYCGFSLDNKIKRKTLMDFEIKLEVAALKEAGFDHVLLVAGEAIYGEYQLLLNAIDVIKDQFSLLRCNLCPKKNMNVA